MSEPSTANRGRAAILLAVRFASQEDQWRAVDLVASAFDGRDAEVTALRERCAQAELHVANLIRVCAHEYEGEDRLDACLRGRAFLASEGTVAKPNDACVRCLSCKRCAAACDCTGGPQVETECTCYEVTGSHQPGCAFNRRPSRAASEGTGTVGEAPVTQASMETREAVARMTSKWPVVTTAPALSESPVPGEAVASTARGAGVGCGKLLGYVDHEAAHCVRHDGAGKCCALEAATPMGRLSRGRIAGYCGLCGQHRDAHLLADGRCPAPSPTPGERDDNKTAAVRGAIAKWRDIGNRTEAGISWRDAEHVLGLLDAAWAREREARAQAFVRIISALKEFERADHPGEWRSGIEAATEYVERLAKEET